MPPGFGGGHPGRLRHLIAAAVLAAGGWASWLVPGSCSPHLRCSELPLVQKDITGFSRRTPRSPPVVRLGCEAEGGRGGLRAVSEPGAWGTRTVRWGHPARPTALCVAIPALSAATACRVPSIAHCPAIRPFFESLSYLCHQLRVNRRDPGGSLIHHGELSPSLSPSPSPQPQPGHYGAGTFGRDPMLAMNLRAVCGAGLRLWLEPCWGAPNVPAVNKGARGHRGRVVHEGTGGSWAGRGQTAPLCEASPRSVSFLCLHRWPSEPLGLEGVGLLTHTRFSMNGCCVFGVWLGALADTISHGGREHPWGPRKQTPQILKDRCFLQSQKFYVDSPQLPTLLRVQLCAPDELGFRLP